MRGVCRCMLQNMTDMFVSPPTPSPRFLFRMCNHRDDAVSGPVRAALGTAGEPQPNECSDRLTLYPVSAGPSQRCGGREFVS